MGYFDGLTAALFQKDTQGQTLFFPHGMLGRGRVLPNSATEQRVRQFVRRYYQIAMPAVIGSAVLFRSLWVLALAPVLIAGFRWRLRPLLADCPYSPERGRWLVALTATARGHGRVTLSVLLIGALAFVALGLWQVDTAASAHQFLIDWTGVGFFGAIAVVAGVMLSLARS